MNEHMINYAMFFGIDLSIEAIKEIQKIQEKINLN